MSRLPADFTSFYRLFLRTSSASVLHQPRAVKSLRKLWRPTFDDAARTTARLQTDELSALDRSDMETWLKIWHRRMDNTLAMLYTSSKTRGLSHRLTRNLALLLRGEQVRINGRRVLNWKPELPASAAQYQSTYLNPEIIAEQKRQAEQAHGWDALEEVIRMAEGRNELLLGRISLKRNKY
ncbi:hypothetical protein B0H15DRAFT_543879 [Mycena belliarum]|uniref:Uncharacterized protein n=1 Tax=Mycena belliarum TaxID=1033014 RepID=A0AAD6UDS9_9AGAR|nr:hypothetical protein B0H15DRAFT_543879 [Mycena belliae]